MRRLFLKAFVSLVMTSTLWAATPTYARQAETERSNRSERPVVQRRLPGGIHAGSLPFVRTELFFGTARIDEGPVTEADFKGFLDQEITERFPDGLTLVKADGQFKDASGTVIKEDAFVLVLLYPYDSRKDSHVKIETIRTLYKDRFAQQSVLRVDDPFIVWVSF